MSRVRSTNEADASAWLELRCSLWPETERAELAQEVTRYFAGDRRFLRTVLLACDEDDLPVGFAELSLRSVAEGCDSDRVAYLEGWYVAPAARRRGLGRALIRACEEWARGQGCTEFGSDTQIDNSTSAAAHAALGFAEVERLRCFSKKL